MDVKVSGESGSCYRTLLLDDSFKAELIKKAKLIKKPKRKHRLIVIDTEVYYAPDNPLMDVLDNIRDK